MVSISLTIFLKINQTVFAALSESGYAKGVAVLWLLRLALSFFAFPPFAWHYNEQSPTSVEAFHIKMVRRKRLLSWVGTFCFFGVVAVGDLVFR